MTVSYWAGWGMSVRRTWGCIWLVVCFRLGFCFLFLFLVFGLFVVFLRGGGGGGGGRGRSFFLFFFFSFSSAFRQVEREEKRRRL